MTLGEALTAAKEKLVLNSVPSPYLNAEVLLQRLLGVEKVFLMAHPEKELAVDVEQKYLDWVERRARGEPAQYITGWQEFWGLDFVVTPEVLIPRPETEHLVETVLKLNQASRPVIADVGTGSGCIAVALAKEIPLARIVAIDQSEGALRVAARNAEKHGVNSQIEFKLGDLLAPLDFEGSREALDFVVSNPPYVPYRDRESLPVEVRNFEPAGALHAEHDDPLGVYRRLIEHSSPRLRAGGYLVAEIGGGQQRAIQELFDPQGWVNLHFVDDLQSIPRVVVARRI
ncbi:MAG: peptide chain release factor N(5)-glutamine methyltransferase [Acidobacteriia bacterium]|nr:peptide chain release factor N(5)-glutamine methyltransferase [Terriglobia bacterium]